MAQRVRVLLEDDIDHSQASQTVRFGVDGSDYEIDLNDEHSTQLRDTFGHWIRHARKTSTSRTNRRSTSTRMTPVDQGEQLNKIRVWGRRNGYTSAAADVFPKD